MQGVVLPEPEARSQDAQSTSAGCRAREFLPVLEPVPGMTGSAGLTGTPLRRKHGPKAYGGQGNGVGKGYNLAMFTQPFHVLDNHNATLSEGGGLPVVVQACSEKPHGTRGGTDFLHPMRQGVTKVPLACPCGKAIELMRKPESMTLRTPPQRPECSPSRPSIQAGPRGAGINSPCRSSAGICAAQNTISGIR